MAMSISKIVLNTEEHNTCKIYIMLGPVDLPVVIPDRNLTTHALWQDTYSVKNVYVLILYSTRIILAQL